MASKSISLYLSHTLTLTVSNTIDNANNRSWIAWTLSVSGDSTYYDTYVKATVNGSVVYNKTVGWNGGFPAQTGSTSGGFYVSHNSDGSKSISMALEGYVYSYSTSYTSGTLTCTKTDRTAPTVTNTITNITKDGFKLVVGSNTTVASSNGYAYQLNGGTWNYNNTGTFNVTGLTTNTSYTVNAAAKKSSNNVWGYKSQTITTLGQSDITSITGGTLGTTPSSSAFNFEFTPYSNDFSFILTLTCGNKTLTVPSSGKLSPGSTSAQTYYLTSTGATTGTNLMTVANWAPYITTATGVITASLATYSGDTLIGSTTQTFNVTVPTSGIGVSASTSNLVLSDNNKNNNNISKDVSATIFIKGMSALKVVATLTRGSGTSTNLKYNAGIKSVSLVVRKTNSSGTIIANISNATIVNNSSNSVATLLTSVLNDSTLGVGTANGTLWYSLTIVDTRDTTTSVSSTFTLYNYWAPTGTITYLINNTDRGIDTITTWTIAPVGNYNSKTISIKRERVSTGGVVTISNPSTTGLDVYSGNYTWEQDNLDAYNSETYKYTLTVADSISSATFEASTGVVCISRHRGGQGITFFADASNAEIAEGGLWANSIRLDLTTTEYLKLASDLSDEYSASIAYEKGDFVYYTVGSTVNVYEAIAAGTNHTPNTATSYWVLLGVKV